MQTSPRTEATKNQASTDRDVFGTGRDGEAVHRTILRNAAGMSVATMSYGATVLGIRVPDRSGQARDVVLGFRQLADYLAPHPRLGAIMGRYANRIGGATFSLGASAYRLTINEGSNTLHGGNRGFDRSTWKEAPVPGETEGASVAYEHTSPDGDEGFPGTLVVRVTYTLTPGNALCIDYSARTDRETVLNLTNHCYFNLSGEASGSALDHELTIFADAYTPVGPDLVPTGEIRSVSDTVFDFRVATVVGARIRSGDEQLVRGKGYDHNYVLTRQAPAPGAAPTLAARLRSAKTGIVLETLTTEPGLQLHTGNVLTGAHVGHGGSAYRQSDGICLETQKFPDSPNKPHFPSATLKPGEDLRSRTIYQFRVDPR